MKDKLIRFQQEAKPTALNIIVNKTKELRINTQIEEKLSVNKKEIEQVESFVYLGYRINSVLEITKQEPVDIQIRKWRWIGHTLRKPAGAIEKDILDRNPQGARRRG
jgi:tyrosine-protein phosphatase YwqE